MIRITGGKARGVVVREAVPDGVRPTSARVREALFSMVGQDLADHSVLDAFAGAGLVALEAWSRGAAVTAVEKDSAVLRSLACRCETINADITLRRGDVLKLVPSMDPFDGVFADPPYADTHLDILTVLAPLARKWLVLEASRKAEFPEVVGELRLDRQRQYGRSSLWVFRR